MNDYIPTLIKTDFNYQKIFIDSIKLESSDEDFFEQTVSQYPNTILDIFDKQLNKNSNELKYLESEYFRLTNEDKYLNFITECFKENFKQCFVDISVDFKDYENFIYYSNRLDEIDQHLLLRQLVNLDNTEDTIYLVEDINLLKMLMKGICREIFHATLFFPKKPLLLFSNYDLSLPIICKDSNTLEYYRKIAESNQLYFR